ncbi:hypothetical protein B0H17DRAFT_1082807 [Mycena rosella]|uniref:Uncharacterized protein n=1 Tax=Mycena rosella TaxID=1033263 RepID=A0AAD7D2I5_MYCRO|nr:hypothetical protein B0H17DRAFT_1082807 [Mycena rosella]
MRNLTRTFLAASTRFFPLRDLALAFRVGVGRKDFGIPDIGDLQRFVALRTGKAE